MSQSTANVNLATETFQNWLTKTNELRFALQTIIVTANSTLGNTSGNCHINGYLAANTLVAVGNLMGGTISTNSSALPQISAANLNIISNTVFSANVYINAGLTLSDGSIGTHSNTHIFNSNLTANGNSLIVGSSTRLVANGGVGSAGQVLASSGTGVYWVTVAGGGGNSNVQVLDSVVNTSISYAASANSVKTAYDAATAAYANAVAVAHEAVFGGGIRIYNANVTANGQQLIISTHTGLNANGTIGTAGQVLLSNGTSAYWSTAIPTLTSQLTNDSGFIGPSSNLDASNLATGTVALARLNAATLRNVSTGYTGSAQVWIQSATPTSPAKGDIWFAI